MTSSRLVLPDLLHGVLRRTNLVEPRANILPLLVLFVGISPVQPPAIWCRAPLPTQYDTRSPCGSRTLPLTASTPPIFCQIFAAHIWFSFLLQRSDLFAVINYSSLNYINPKSDSVRYWLFIPSTPSMTPLSYAFPVPHNVTPLTSLILLLIRHPGPIFEYTNIPPKSTTALIYLALSWLFYSDYFMLFWIWEIWYFGLIILLNLRKSSISFEQSLVSWARDLESCAWFLADSTFAPPIKY